MYQSTIALILHFSQPVTNVFRVGAGQMSREANLNLIVLLMFLATIAVSVLANMVNLQQHMVAVEQEVLFELPVGELANIRVTG